MGDYITGGLVSTSAHYAKTAPHLQMILWSRKIERDLNIGREGTGWALWPNLEPRAVKFNFVQIPN
jgi:hypothetical protein